MLIEWKEEYNLGIKKIDEQHQNLVKILNKIYELIDQRKFDNEIIGLLDELNFFTVEHFSFEEKYFEEFNFKFKERHIQEHNLFKEKLKELKGLYQEEKIKVSFDLIDYLEDWFLNHLRGVDIMYVSLFKEHGLS